MYAAVATFIFMCIGATTLADHHTPCHSPNMTGILTVYNIKGDTHISGDYAYDHVAKKLRFKSNETVSSNGTQNVDVLMCFEEGIFYEIDSKNQSCEKKALQSSLHPLEVPSDAEFESEMYLGSATVVDEGLKINVWTGTIPAMKAHFTVSATMGCLPVSVVYTTDTLTLLISNLNTETEIKDPDFFTLPSFCEGEISDEPEGTVNSFFNLFH